MRVYLAVFALAVLIVGCASERPKPSAGTGTTDTSITKDADQTSESLSGEYIGKLNGEVDAADSPLPPSIREAIGDSLLTLSDGTFTMTHQGIVLEGDYKLESDDLVLSVTKVEGLDKSALATVDLAANKKAGKEPSDADTLERCRQAIQRKDWRFKASSNGFTERQSVANEPYYTFERKPN